MNNTKQMTPGEASALRKEAVDASVERDIAVYNALRSSRREAEAIDDAREQQDKASVALRIAINERDVAVNAVWQASGREAVAVEDAREQHADMLSAQAEGAQINTLLHVASVRANQEARGAYNAKFGFYLLVGLVVATSAIVITMWITRSS